MSFEISDVTMRYNRGFLRFGGDSSREVLRDLSFSIGAGERVGLLGVNGAGKTTLIKLMLGILRPTSGSIQFAGHPASAYPDSVKTQMGVIFAQRSQLWWNVPVQDSLEIIGLMYGLDDQQVKERRTSLVDDLEIADLIGRAPRFLSFGQRIRCEIAAALIPGPRFLFLDEAFIGLDSQYKERILRFLRNLSETAGTTIVFASHDLEYLEGLVDRALILDGSRLVLDSPIGSLVPSQGKRVKVLMRYPDPVDPHEVLALNSLATLFPGTSWELERSHRRLIQLDIPVPESRSIDDVHALLREAQRAESLEFREGLTIRDILEDLSNADPCHRRRQLNDVMGDLREAQDPVEQMYHLSLLRRFRDPDDVNQVILPLLVSRWDEEPDARVRAFIPGLLPCQEPFLDDPARLMSRELLLRALDDPDSRVRAAGIEAAGHLFHRSASRLDKGTDRLEPTIQEATIHEATILEKVRQCLESPDIRSRANAHVALIGIERDPDRLRIFAGLVGDVNLRSSFLHSMRIIASTAPFTSPSVLADDVHVEYVHYVRELLNLWMEDSCKLAPSTVTRFLMFLKREQEL